MGDLDTSKTDVREVTIGHQSSYEPHMIETEVLSLQTLDNVPSNPDPNIPNDNNVLEESKFDKIKTNTKNILSKYLKFVGPGIMVAVAYIDPGNYSTAVSAGASNEFSLLCIVLLSNFIAIFLQCLCIKLGSVTGKDLSRNCYEHLPRWLNYIIYFFAECAIISTDVAEVIGTAIALNILIKVPLPAGVVITIVDVLTVMVAYKPGASSMRFIRYFEMGVALLVVGVCICFAIELAYIPKETSVRHVFRGFVPSSQMFEHNGIYTAISILGATVMPHSLFLGSGLVQPRLLDYDIAHNNLGVLTDNIDDEEEVEVGNSNAINRDEEDKKRASREQSMEDRYFNYRPTLDAIRYCMKYSMVELTLTLFTLALFVNCAILVVSGSTLYNTPNAADADLYAVHDLLSSNLAPAAGTIFMLALLFSGQSAGIVCTMAGQIVCEGHINWKLAPWQRRLVTRCISIIPCLVISISIGKEALNKALNASQVVLSIVLPFLVAPLIYFTCSKKIMRTEVTVHDSDLDITEQHLKQEEKNIDIVENEDGTTIKVVNMANNWIVTIIAGIVWVFLSLLNVYAIVQLGLTHGDVS
ncbi:similar to Saccharomyces cerevisiae YOL122C SMF1 Divalent metal ion transporter with a broad specificity for di-valent and tri-valent metals [Maudiozyma saulgeensis]|uniref:Similar to Saccharomyces cerevisiae YOL122C SMF1 Divalent metal ion transporter with a broad specificity for di-valent and tri-valent metals n=1 Tax=Maudiozyma saulgeensis TaxID=1789683 RepID=A0A1X7RB67_9SACH|nr:similar to Saccharomyces cerevisiae YOL122C SMF1 Divalent metal ion transporter with a broad specificity for di-valent and tri-valent metals [Kazachstania saulgeensis]